MKSGIFKAQFSELLNASPLQSANDKLTPLKTFAIKSIASALVFSLIFPDAVRAMDSVEVRATAGGRTVHSTFRKTASAPDLQTLKTLEGTPLREMGDALSKHKRSKSADSTGSDTPPDRDSSATREQTSEGDSTGSPTRDGASSPDSSGSPTGAKAAPAGFDEAAAEAEEQARLEAERVAAEAEAAARSIQRVWRGHQGRQEAKLEAKIATLLQGVLRNHEEQLARVLEKRQQHLALTTQRLWRGHQARLQTARLRTETEAATLIQARLRGLDARRKYRAQREEARLEATAKLSAASKIQHAWRAHKRREAEEQARQAEALRLEAARQAALAAEEQARREEEARLEAERLAAAEARRSALDTPSHQLDDFAAAGAGAGAAGVGPSVEDEQLPHPARATAFGPQLHAFFEAPFSSLERHAVTGAARPHTPAGLHGSINNNPFGFHPGASSGSAEGEEAALLGRHPHSTYGAAGADLEAAREANHGPSKKAIAQKLLGALLEADPEASAQALSAWFQDKIADNAGFLDRPFVEVLRALLEEYGALIPEETNRTIRAQIEAAEALPATLTDTPISEITMRAWLTHYGLEFNGREVVEVDRATVRGKAAAPSEAEHAVYEGLRSLLLIQVGESHIREEMKALSQRIEDLDPSDPSDERALSFLRHVKAYGIDQTSTWTQLLVAGISGTAIAVSIANAMPPIFVFGLFGLGKNFNYDIEWGSQWHAYALLVHTGVSLGIDALSRNVTKLWKLAAPSTGKFTIPLPGTYKLMLFLPWLGAALAALLPVDYLGKAEEFVVSSDPSMKLSSSIFFGFLAPGLWLDALFTNVGPATDWLRTKFTQRAVDLAFAGERYTATRLEREETLQRLDDLEGLFRFSADDTDIADWFEFVHTYGAGHLTQDPPAYDGAYEAREALRMLEALNHIHALNPYEEREQSPWKTKAVDILGWGIPATATLGRSLVFYAILLSIFAPQHLVSKIFAGLLGGGIASAFLGSVEVSATKQAVREILNVEGDEGGDTTGWKIARRTGKTYNFAQGAENTIPYLLVGILATTGWPLPLQIMALSVFGLADTFNNAISFNESYGDIFKAGRRLLAKKHTTAGERREWLLWLVRYLKEKYGSAHPDVFEKTR